MDIKSCYEKMGANYEEAFARLQNEALIANVSKNSSMIKAIFI